MFGDPVVEVTVSPDGKNTKIEVKNVPDASCLKMTESLEEALGVVTKRVKKAEGVKEAKVGAGAVKVGQ
jgi:hypothetical protein